MKEGKAKVEQNDKKMADWQTLSKHLDVQMQLGVMDAKDALEKEKASLEKWLHQVGDSLDANRDAIKDENILKLRGSINDLRKEAAQPRPDTNDAFEKQQDKIDNSLSELQTNFVNSLDSLHIKFQDLPHEMRDKLNAFATHFDLFKLQIHMGASEASEAWDKKKKELGSQLTDLKSKIADGVNKGQEDWADYSKEVSNDWDKFRESLKTDSN